MTIRALIILALAVAPLASSCNGETPQDESTDGATSSSTPSPTSDPDCGNGYLEEGEVCEGSPPPEGCNPNTCQVQVGWVCSPDPPNTQGDDTDDAFQPVEWQSMCEQVDTCGDGVLDPGELCDDGDGNVQEGLGDGCSNCTIDPLWQCQTEPGMPSECWQCGDGFLDSEFGEECDDGHEADGVGMDTPGCTMACMVEDGWECFQGVDQTSACQPLCGDGMWFDESVEGVNIGSAEGCDDGNLLDGDGCDSNCNVEEDCTCEGPVEGTSTCFCGMGTTTTTDTDTDGMTSGTTGGGTGTSTG